MFMADRLASFLGDATDWERRATIFIEYSIKSSFPGKDKLPNLLKLILSVLRVARLLKKEV
jgi:hypothetical protein